MVFDGHFTDGKTARRHVVTVVCADNRLQIFDRYDALLAEWPFDGLQLIGEVSRRQPIRLSHRTYGEAALSLANHDILDVLGRTMPRFRRKRVGGDNATIRLLIWSGALVLVTIALLKGVPLLAGPLAHLVPAHWEQAWGEQMMELMGEDVTGCESVEGQAALLALTEQLTATAELPFPFKVQVSNTPLVNAMALPGGRIVVFQGLITAAQSPEEVAGVLAHEIAHQIQRHPMRGLIRTAGLRLVIGALSGGSGAAFSLGGVGELILGLSYDRQDETEADRIGVEMLNKANIRGDGLVAFFARASAGEKNKSSETEHNATSRVGQFLSTHPADEARVAAIKARSRGTESGLTKKQWQALQSICQE
jgi:Zn-dependent protease with chaperone function